MQLKKNYSITLITLLAILIISLPSIASLIINNKTCDSRSKLKTNNIELESTSFKVSNISPVKIFTTKLKGKGTDLVVTGKTQDKEIAAILKGTDSKAFTLPKAFYSGKIISKVLTADLNSDSLTDILALSNSKILIFYGEADGYSEPAIIEEFKINDFSLGDLNNDNEVDIIISSEGSVWAILNGKNSKDIKLFSQEEEIKSIKTSDFNKDGILDISTLNKSELTIYYGAKGLSFKAKVLSNESVSSFKLGDLNSDGNIDIATTNSTEKKLSIYLNNGKEFSEVIKKAIDGIPQSIEIADINGDCNKDIISLTGENNISALIGQGNGVFNPSIEFNLNFDSKNSHTASADVDNDGLDEIFILSPEDKEVLIISAKSKSTNLTAKTRTVCQATCQGATPTCCAGASFMCSDPNSEKRCLNTTAGVQPLCIGSGLISQGTCEFDLGCEPSCTGGEATCCAGKTFQCNNSDDILFCTKEGLNSKPLCLGKDQIIRLGLCTDSTSGGPPQSCSNKCTSNPQDIPSDITCCLNIKGSNNFCGEVTPNTGILSGITFKSMFSGLECNSLCSLRDTCSAGFDAANNNDFSWCCGENLNCNDFCSTGPTSLLPINSQQPKANSQQPLFIDGAFWGELKTRAIRRVTSCLTAGDSCVFESPPFCCPGSFCDPTTSTCETLPTTPTATATATPTTTPTPTPTATATPTTTATATPSATATSSPTATASPSPVCFPACTAPCEFCDGSLVIPFCAPVVPAPPGCGSCATPTPTITPIPTGTPTITPTITSTPTTTPTSSLISDRRFRRSEPELSNYIRETVSYLLRKAYMDFESMSTNRYSKKKLKKRNKREILIKGRMFGKGIKYKVEKGNKIWKLINEVEVTPENDFIVKANKKSIVKFSKVLKERGVESLSRQSLTELEGLKVTIDKKRSTFIKFVPLPPPICPAPMCGGGPGCAASETCCDDGFGGMACYTGDTCCGDALACDSTTEACCSDGMGGMTCLTGAMCCGDGAGTACPAGESCCDNGMGGMACTAGGSCCGGGLPCAAGEICCGSMAMACIMGLCCPGGSDCFGGDVCCNDGSGGTACYAGDTCCGDAMACDSTTEVCCGDGSGGRQCFMGTECCGVAKDEAPCAVGEVCCDDALIIGDGLCLMGAACCGDGAGTACPGGEACCDDGMAGMACYAGGSCCNNPGDCMGANELCCDNAGGAMTCKTGSCCPLPGPDSCGLLEICCDSDDDPVITDNICVDPIDQCCSDASCPGGAGAGDHCCDEGGNRTCQVCCDNTHCPAATPVCFTIPPGAVGAGNKACTECQVMADCLDPAKPKCIIDATTGEGTCSECQVMGDCPAIQPHCCDLDGGGKACKECCDHPDCPGALVPFRGDTPRCCNFECYNGIKCCDGPGDCDDPAMVDGYDYASKCQRCSDTNPGNGKEEGVCLIAGWGDGADGTPGSTQCCQDSEDCKITEDYQSYYEDTLGNGPGSAGMCDNTCARCKTVAFMTMQCGSYLGSMNDGCVCDARCTGMISLRSTPGMANMNYNGPVCVPSTVSPPMGSTAFRCMCRCRLDSIAPLAGRGCVPDDGTGAWIPGTHKWCCLYMNAFAPLPVYGLCKDCCVHAHCMGDPFGPCCMLGMCGACTGSFAFRTIDTNLNNEALLVKDRKNLGLLSIIADSLYSADLSNSFKFTNKAIKVLHTKIKKRISLEQPHLDSFDENSTSLISVDINNDGTPDLISLSSNLSNLPVEIDSNISIKTGTGNSTFNPEIKTSLDLIDLSNIAPLMSENGFQSGGSDNAGEAPIPMKVIAEDFNNDSKKDLLITTFDQNIPHMALLILKGEGNSFKKEKLIHVGINTTDSNPIVGDTGDFNHDGLKDFAVAYYNEINDYTGSSTINTIAIYLNKGSFNFELKEELVIPSGDLADTIDSQIDIVDLDKDGNDDIVLNGLNHNSEPPLSFIAIFKGNGDGTFADISKHLLALGISSFTINDFNGDSKLDILASSFGFEGFPEKSFILEQQSDKSFKLRETNQFSKGLVYSKDLDNDSKIDLVVVNSTTNNLEVFNGDGKFGFTKTNELTTGLNSIPNSVILEDFNKDNKPDIVVSVIGSNDVFIFNNSSSTVDPPINTCEEKCNNQILESGMRCCAAIPQNQDSNYRWCCGKDISCKVFCEGSSAGIAGTENNRNQFCGEVKPGQVPVFGTSLRFEPSLNSEQCEDICEDKPVCSF